MARDRPGGSGGIDAGFHGISTAVRLILHREIPPSAPSIVTNELSGSAVNRVDGDRGYCDWFVCIDPDLVYLEVFLFPVDL